MFHTFVFWEKEVFGGFRKVIIFNANSIGFWNKLDKFLFICLRKLNSFVKCVGFTKMVMFGIILYKIKSQTDICCHSFWHKLSFLTHFTFEGSLYEKQKIRKYFAMNSLLETHSERNIEWKLDMTPILHIKLVIQSLFIYQYIPHFIWNRFEFPKINITLALAKM